MSNALDMCLDDLIKSNKKSGSGNPNKGRGIGSAGSGPIRRSRNRPGNRPSPYSLSKAPESAWQHDKYSDQRPANSFQGSVASSIETGTKLYISNLDYGVSNDDIKELFSEVGDLKRFSVHYDRSGRSKGTAEVVFARKVDALSAVKKYNNVQLDGQPMRIEVVGTNMEKPVAITRVSGGGSGDPSGAPKSALRSVGAADGGGRRRRGRTKGNKANTPLSASELDADLDSYHASATQG